MNEQTPTPAPQPTDKPTEWHRYVDDNGRCAVCGITMGRLTFYRRGRDGQPRLPSPKQWHRRATEAEAKQGLSWVVRSPGRYGKTQRNVGGRLVLHDVPLHVIHAAAFMAAGESQRVAAGLAGVQPKSLSDWKRRNPALWAQVEQMAACIAERFTELARRKPRKDQPAHEGNGNGKPAGNAPVAFGPGPLADTSGEGQTLAEFFEKVYRPLRLLNCSKATPVQYRVSINLLDRYAGRPVCVADLSDDLLAGFMSAMLDAGRSPHTVNKLFRHITAVWRRAYKRKLVADLPGVDPVRTPKRIPDAWTLAEFDLLLKTAAATPGMVDDTVPAGQWWAALLLVLYETGLRVGAVVQLDRTALDAEAGWLHVPAELQKHNCDQRFKLHPDTLAAVKAVMAVGVGKRLFPWPLRREALYQTMRRILDRAGLPSGRRDLFHKIRRTAATGVADKLGRAAAQDFLGHSAMHVTQMYLDPSKINRVQAVDILPRPAIPEIAGNGQAGSNGQDSNQKHDNQQRDQKEQ